MGKHETKPGRPAALRSMLLAPRRGAANRDLITALLLVGVIAFLMQLQTGSINLSSLMAKKQSTSADKSTGGGGAPELLPSVSDPYRAAGTAYLLQREKQLQTQRVSHWRLITGLGQADGDAGARLLSQLTPPMAAAMLNELPPRSIARILEAADPAVGAKWIELLATPQALPPVPDDLKALAAKAGLYDNTEELLASARQATGAGNAADAGAADLQASGADASATGTGAPADPAAAGAAPGGSPPASPPTDNTAGNTATGGAATGAAGTTGGP